MKPFTQSSPVCESVRRQLLTGIGDLAFRKQTFGLRHTRLSRHRTRFETHDRNQCRNAQQIRSRVRLHCRSSRYSLFASRVRLFASRSRVTHCFIIIPFGLSHASCSFLVLPVSHFLISLRRAFHLASDMHSAQWLNERQASRN